VQTCLQSGNSTLQGEGQGVDETSTPQGVSTVCVQPSHVLVT